MKRFWIAHARGPNFSLLRDRGFVTFYPTMDDYVFLEVSEQNEKLLRKQSELCVAFVKDKKGKLQTVSQAELDRMRQKSTAGIEPGSMVLSVDGIASNLEGIVKAVKDNIVQVVFNGLSRVYDLEVDAQTLVLRTDDGKSSGN